MKRISIFFLVFWLSGVVFATDDPCNFSHGEAFMPEQVLECYSKVPYSHDRAEQYAKSIEAISQLSDLANTYRNTGQPLNIHVSLPKVAQEIRSTPYADDYSMHQAISKNIKRYKNGHWGYYVPLCYQRLQPYLPIVLGATLQNGKQIIYVKGVHDINHIYKNTTSQDLSPLIGQRIVSINGIDAVQYLARLANQQLSWFPYSSNNFSSLLAFHFFSSMFIADYQSVDLSPTYVFQTKSQQRTTLKLPYIFVPREKLFYQLSPVAPDLATSTDEFIAQCTVPWQMADYFLHEHLVRSDGSVNEALSSPYYGVDAISQREQFIRKMNRKMSAREVNAANKYHDITASDDDLPFEMLEDHLNNQIAYGHLGDSVTVLKITGFTPSDYDDFVGVMQRAVQYACSHSDNIMIDLSGNHGGSGFLLSYLVGLIDFNQSRNNILIYSFLSKDKKSNPLAFHYLDAADKLSPPYVETPLCLTLNEPGCYHKANGDKIMHWDDVSHHRVEVRGGVRTELTDKVYESLLPSYQYITVPSYCSGKFNQENTIIITDGAAASAGFFSQVYLRRNAQIIAYGGLYKSKMNIGTCHGGAIHKYNMYAYQKERYHLYDDQLSGLLPDELFSMLEGFDMPKPMPQRSEITFEAGGAYDDQDKSRLTAVKEYLPDKHVWIWDDSNKSAFYSRILRAIH